MNDDITTFLIQKEVLPIVKNVAYRRIAALALLVLLVISGARPICAASEDVQIVTFDQAIVAIEHARSSITISAYTISPHQDQLLQALSEASRRHVSVHILLTGDGFEYAIEQNCELVAAGKTDAPSTRTCVSSQRGEDVLPDLRDVRVTLSSRPLHLKGLVVDHGDVVALDDTNWSTSGQVLFFDRSYALPIERAMIGDPHDALPLTVTKGSSLRFEAALLRQARRSIVVKTESFSEGNPVSDEIESALGRKVPVLLIVAYREAHSNASELRYLSKLQHLGATVIFQSGTAKGALFDDHLAWIGSSNATSGLEDQLDWGFASTNAAFVEKISQALFDQRSPEKRGSNQ